MRRLVTVLMLLLCSAAAVAGAAPEARDDGFWIPEIWNVDVVNGNDLNDGKTAPFKTIKKAVSVATATDWIIVQPGTYTVATGEIFPIVLPSGVKLFSAQGARVTVIDLNGINNKNAFDLNAANEGTLIQGFTIAHGLLYGSSPNTALNGGAIVCRNSSFAVIERNLIRNFSLFSAKGTAAHPAGGFARGAGIYVDGSSGCTIRNNVLRGNNAHGGDGYPLAQASGGGAFGASIYSAGSAQILQNTIASSQALAGDGSPGNAATKGGNGGAASGGAIYAGGSANVIANNLFSVNKTFGGAGGLGNPNGNPGNGTHGGLFGGNSTVTHNMFYASIPAEPSPYPNSVFGFPAFQNWDTMQLLINGPAVLAGSAAYTDTYDFDGVKRGTPPSIGATEMRVRFDTSADYKADLVWRKSDSGENAVWLMNGLQIASSAFITNAPPGWEIAGSGDFNADRKTDLFWRNAATGENAVWYLDGNGMPAPKVVAAKVGPLKVEAVNDFNLDGSADVLWRNTGTGGVSVAMMSGSTVLRETALTPLPVEWTVAGSGDFDQDGFPDLLWRNGTTGENMLWSMAGAAIKSTQMLASAGTDWKVMGVADFGNDATDDILWRNGVTGENVIWPWRYGDAQPPVYTVQLADMSWSVAKTADVSGDGRADIVWRHALTGDLAVWLMKNEVVTSSGFLPVQLADPNWKCAP